MLLVIATSATAVAAVVALVEPHEYGTHTDAIFAIVGIITLIASLVVASARLNERALRAFACYREIQRIAVRFESLEVFTGSTGELLLQLHKLENKYQRILDHSENHSQVDYILALRETIPETKYRELRVKQKAVGPIALTFRFGSFFMTQVPLVLCIVPVLMVIPVVRILIFRV